MVTFPFIIFLSIFQKCYYELVCFYNKKKDILFKQAVSLVKPCETDVLFHLSASASQPVSQIS